SRSVPPRQVPLFVWPPDGPFGFAPPQPASHPALSLHREADRDMSATPPPHEDGRRLRRRSDPPRSPPPDVTGTFTEQFHAPKSGSQGTGRRALGQWQGMCPDFGFSSNAKGSVGSAYWPA